MEQPASRASTRKLLQAVLLTDAEFDAFCIDYFPAIKTYFADGMNRLQKTNLLLEMATSENIVSCLSKEHSTAVTNQIRRVENFHDGNDDAKIEWYFVISAQLSEMNKTKAAAIIDHLKLLANDVNITFTRMQAGSVILVLSSFLRSFEILYDLHQKRSITLPGNYRIIDITTDLSARQKFIKQQLFSQIDGSHLSRRIEKWLSPKLVLLAIAALFLVLYIAKQIRAGAENAASNAAETLSNDKPTKTVRW